MKRETTLTKLNEPALHKSPSQHWNSQVSSDPQAWPYKSFSFKQVSLVWHPFRYSMTFFPSIINSVVNLPHSFCPGAQRPEWLFCSQSSMEMVLWHIKHFKSPSESYCKLNILSVFTLKMTYHSGFVDKSISVNNSPIKDHTHQHNHIPTTYKNIISCQQSTRYCGV